MIRGIAFWSFVFVLKGEKELRLSLFLGEFVFFSQREKERKKMGKFFGWAVIVVS